MLTSNCRAAEILLSMAAKVKRQDLLYDMGMSRFTFANRVRNPGDIRLSELAAFQHALGLSTEKVLDIYRAFEQESKK